MRTLLLPLILAAMPALAAEIATEHFVVTWDDAATPASDVARVIVALQLGRATALDMGFVVPEVQQVRFEGMSTEGVFPTNAVEANGTLLFDYFVVGSTLPTDIRVRETLRGYFHTLVSAADRTRECQLASARDTWLLGAADYFVRRAQPNNEDLADLMAEYRLFFVDGHENAFGYWVWRHEVQGDSRALVDFLETCTPGSTFGGELFGEESQELMSDYFLDAVDMRDFPEDFAAREENVLPPNSSTNSIFSGSSLIVHELDPSVSSLQVGGDGLTQFTLIFDRDGERTAEPMVGFTDFFGDESRRFLVGWNPDGRAESTGEFFTFAGADDCFDECCFDECCFDGCGFDDEPFEGRPLIGCSSSSLPMSARAGLLGLLLIGLLLRRRG